MAEELVINGKSREEIYNQLITQLESLLSGEKNIIARLALISAAIKQSLDFFWVGFYLVDAVNNSLVLGPFQGPIACLRIHFNSGVCGKAWAELRPIIVPDVNLFPGHIACSNLSKSEIVIPFYHQNKMFGVLDIDSEQLNDFTHTDQFYLDKILTLK